MNRRRIAQLLGGVALLALTAACTAQEPEITTNDQVAAEDRVEETAAGGGAGGGGEATGEVVQWAAGNELAYSVAPDTVPADTELVFELTLEGLPHDVVIEGINGDQPIVEGDGAGTFTGTVTLPPGEYTYYCNVPGHRAAGMEGTLVAQ